MVQINQAWEMLRDPIRRAAVDRARARAAATSARATAAEAQADVRSTAAAPAAGHTRYRSAASRHRPSGRPGRATPPRGQGPGWPIPGMRTTGPATAPTASRPTGHRALDVPAAGTTRRRWGRPRATAPPARRPATRPGACSGFGRYAGWSLGEIARTDLEYLEWLDRMPIGRTYQVEIDALLRSSGRRTTAPAADRQRRGLFRRR